MQFLALSVDDLLRGLWGSLCQFFYWLIAWLYELFMNISRVEILTSNDIKPIYQRITMILTIIMVFYVTFEAVKYVMQPEQFTDKEKGANKLVLKMVLVVIMIAFVPQIFGWAYKFQNVVFDNQIFSKVILGKQEVNTEKFGRVFSANILGMFYYADEDTWGQAEMENGSGCDGVPCKNVVNINLNSLVEYGELPLMQMGLTDTGAKNDEGAGKKVDRYYIHFDGLFAVAVGGFIAYMLVLYCIDAGVRVAQLAFLQIIAPIPIIGYLSPKKDGIFQKWLKQCTTTYLDLFLRVGIIYFVLMVCQILSDAYTTGTLLNNIVGTESTTMKVFIYIALIMGLLLFAKKAPKMLGELFPKSGSASGNFGLSLKDRPALARGAGMAVGAGLVGAKGLISATANRAKRDFRNLKTGKNREDKDSLKQSRQNLREARKNYRQNKATMNATQKKEAKQQIRDAKIDKQSAKAARNNSRFGFAPLSGVAGAVGGAVRGATEGAKATDLKGIGKQVSQGWQNESKALEKTEKWYNEGGGSYFDRVKTSVEKGLGITTDAERIAEEIKYEDDKIKTNDVLIAAESDVKTKTDDAKDRSGSKLEKLEQKTKVAAGTQIKYKDIKGQEQLVDTSVDGTTSSIYDKYRQIAQTKESAADAAAKAAQENPGNLALKLAAETAQQEAAEARRNKEQVKKALEEYAITRILQDPNARSNSEHDGVLIDKVEATKTSIEISKRNATTVESMREALKNDPSLFDVYMSGNITTFKELDDIQTALITIANERTRENTRIKETKRKLEASDANAAAKADSSTAGGK